MSIFDYSPQSNKNLWKIRFNFFFLLQNVNIKGIISLKTVDIKGLKIKYCI